MSRAGHFWAHLIYDNVVIKANDTSISVIDAKRDAKESQKMGTYFSM